MSDNAKSDHYDFGGAADGLDTEEQVDVEQTETEAETPSQDVTSTDTGLDEVGLDAEGVPTEFRRHLNVTDNRTQVSYHLQDETRDQFRRLRRDLAEEFGVEEIPKIDVGEAAVLVGMRHPEEMCRILEAWGWGLD